MPRISIARELPYTPDQLFQIAADVERYPDFLPGWKSARVLQRADGHYVTDQVVGFGPITQHFRTKTILTAPDTIAVSAIDGPFSAFRLNWSFKPLAQHHCRVALDGLIEMRTPFLRAILNQAPNAFADTMLSAFEARARRLCAAHVQ